MKYIKLFEAFTKGYMKKIDLKDFKKIKKGTQLKYLGSPAEVIDNDGYVLTIKGKDGKTFTVNKSQFDHGGMISEIAVTNEANDQDRLTYFRKLGIAPNNQPQNAAYIKQVAKPGKFFVDWKDAFDLGDVALEFVKQVGSISEFDIIDLKTMKRTGEQLDVKKGQLGELRTTYGVRVNESSAKDGGNKSNGNSRHDDHTNKSIAQHWKDTYGEEFHSKYPAIAKIVKSRPGIDKRELKRIWDETYGEDFEEQYPALWLKID
jgi:hypothetical protein